MAEASDTQGILRQNLIDAGCNQELVRRCMDLAQRKETGELARILSQYKRTLLDTIHTEQKKIDCLDYLVWRIEKDQQSERADR